MATKNLEYYMRLPYTINLKRITDDVIPPYWVARVAELPHCMTHGATPEEAIQDIEDAQREWLNSNLERGLQIPEPATYSGQFHLRMTHSLHETLSLLAHNEGVSLNQYIVMTLSRATGKTSDHNIKRAAPVKPG
jgi:antitoxin HicB